MVAQARRRAYDEQRDVVGRGLGADQALEDDVAERVQVVGRRREQHCQPLQAFGHGRPASLHQAVGEQREGAARREPVPDGPVVGLTYGADGGADRLLEWLDTASRVEQERCVVAGVGHVEGGSDGVEDGVQAGRHLIGGLLEAQTVQPPQCLPRRQPIGDVGAQGVAQLSHDRRRT